jgi:hypothetical protein
MCVTMIDDVERNDYCFTDGNGFISKGLARLVAERLDYLVKYEQNVCVFSEIILSYLFMFIRRFIHLLIKFEWLVVKVWL